MNGARIFIALTLLALPAVAVPLVRRGGHPKRWAVLMAVTLGGGFVLLQLALVHASLPVVFDLIGASTFAEVCRRLGGHLLGASPAGSVVAGSSAVVILVASIWHARRVTVINRQLLRHAEAAGRPVRVEDVDVLSVPVASVVALALPGSSPRVVLSHGLIASLREAELAVVVSHEIAHLRHHHARFFILGAAVAGGTRFLPWMGASERALRLALERWADEDVLRGRPERRQPLRWALTELTVSGRRPDLGLQARMGSTASQPPAFQVWGPWSVALGVVPLLAGVTGTLVAHVLDIARLAQ